MTIYKELQTQLKTLKESGIKLQVKLNSKQDVLVAELKRIEQVLTVQEADLVQQLTQVTQPTGVTRAAQVTAWSVHTSKQVFTLLILMVALLHEWDIRFTNSSRVKTIESTTKDILRLLLELSKAQIRAQLGGTLPRVQSALA
jgi:predicted component of viral defense system (DUF524 family)